jgi:hypothetical protein
VVEVLEAATRKYGQQRLVLSCLSGILSSEGTTLDKVTNNITHWVCRLAAVAGTALALLVAPLASMAQGADESVAKAVSVQGTVEVQRVGQSQWQAVKLNDTFRPGDKIRVQERSRADIAMLNQSVLRLNANTTITVEAPKEQKTGVVALIRGAAHFFSRGPNSLEVNTPFTVAGVRGTEFYINLEPEATQLTVFEGTVVAENPSGSLTITNGQWSRIRRRPRTRRRCCWPLARSTRRAARSATRCRPPPTTPTC